MLDRTPKDVPASAQGAAGDIEIGLPQLLAFFRRQRWPIIITTAAVLVLGALYLAVTPPTYTAAATVLIDPRKVAIFGSGNVLEDASITNSGVETQVQVIESGRIARDVVKRLDLTNDAAFMSPGPASLTSMVKGWAVAAKRAVFGSSPEPAPAETGATQDDPVARAAGIVSGHLNASRVGLSYVISVSYTSSDPNEAMRLANGAAEAYLEDQVQGQVDAAQRASEWLEGRLTDLQLKASDTALSAQERSAIRATYDNFLGRYTQTVQQQSMPFADAQVLTPAVAPTKPTAPKSLLVILGSMLVGATIGVGIGLSRELLDKSIKSPKQIEALTHVPFLGFLPAFEMRAGAMRRLSKRARKQIDAEGHRFSGGPAYSIALAAPFSRYAETLRGVKIASQSDSRGRVAVIGVISAGPGEGRSTVAANLARLLAEEGTKSILIDGDVRNPTLSRDFVPPKSQGLVQVVSGTARISDVLWTDRASPLTFLPAGSDAEANPPSGTLSAPATKAVINACRQQFEAVIVDLPATIPVVDVRAAAHLFDGFLMVVEWGQTSEESLARAVLSTGLEDRILGAVLNKVNLRLMKRLEGSDRGAAAPFGNYFQSYRHIA